MNDHDIDDEETAAADNDNDDDGDNHDNNADGVYDVYDPHRSNLSSGWVSKTCPKQRTWNHLGI